MEIDLRVGSSFTRFQTKLINAEFNIPKIDKDNFISYGLCQFPTLGFVVENWERIAHEEQMFWLLKCSTNIGCWEQTVNFSSERGQLFDYSLACELLKRVKDDKRATVTKCNREIVKIDPPCPLNTIELLKRASQYLNMDSYQTMKVAQGLYQDGFISYPRTNTDVFRADTNLQAIVASHKRHKKWGEVATQLLKLMSCEKKPWKRPEGGGHDDKAHPPIYPTKFSSGERGWGQDTLDLYELIVRHFLACLSKPAKGRVTTVQIKIADELFSTHGREILKKNYLEAYKYEPCCNELLIPTYIMDDKLTEIRLTLDKGVTTPPPLLSEKDLLTCMYTNRIGTAATMHHHIKKLLDRSYVTKDADSCFRPTNLGEALVMGYDHIGISDLWKPNLKYAIEEDMKLIRLKTKSKEEALKTSLEKMKACFLKAILNK